MADKETDKKTSKAKSDSKSKSKAAENSSSTNNSANSDKSSIFPEKNTNPSKQINSNDLILQTLTQIQENQKSLVEIQKGFESQFVSLNQRVQRFEHERYDCLPSGGACGYDAEGFGPYSGHYDENYEEYFYEDHAGRQRPSTIQSIDNDNVDAETSAPDKQEQAISTSGNEHYNGLAQSINDLFMNDMDVIQYKDLIKEEENTPRPSNCDGLRTVRINHPVWETISPPSRSNDGKMQDCARAVIKAATILANTVNKLGLMEKDLKDKCSDVDLTPIFEGCNDTLSLLGHSNYLSCMARKDLLKNDLKGDLSKLLSHSIPYTAELFGDDIGESAKEIETMNRVVQKMKGFGNFRGDSPRHRGRGTRGFSKGRGGDRRFPPPRYTTHGRYSTYPLPPPPPQYSYKYDDEINSYDEGKKFQRRGASRGRRH